MPESQLFELMERGALYAHGAKRLTDLDPVASALINGSCALFLEGRDDCLVFPVAGRKAGAPFWGGARWPPVWT